MQLHKLALTLTLSALCFGCRVRVSQSHATHVAASMPQPMLTTSLQAAVEEVGVMKVKIERDGGIHPKEYGEDLADLANIVDKAYGDSKTVEAVKSVVEGHELALQFMRCDRVDGFDEMHQCRDKVLKKLFVKYPDFAAAAKEAVEGEQLPYISAGLDKEAVLQAIWQETGKDTDALMLSVNPEFHAQESSQSELTQ